MEDKDYVLLFSPIFKKVLPSQTVNYPIILYLAVQYLVRCPDPSLTPGYMSSRYS